MPQVPLTGPFSVEDIIAAINTDGLATLSPGETDFQTILAAAKWECFEPSFHAGATSKADINTAEHFRGYPRTLHGNDEVAQLFTTSCADSGSGSSVEYRVYKDTHFSYVSKSVANALAADDIAANGQTYANHHGFCTWYSDPMSAYFNRADCGYMGQGTAVFYAIAAGRASSIHGKSAANSAAASILEAEGQQNANMYGSCTWYNEALTTNLQKQGCGGGTTGTYVSVSASSHQFSSTWGLEVANALRDNWLQEQANLHGTCVGGVSCPGLVDVDHFVSDFPYIYTHYPPISSPITIHDWYVDVAPPPAGYHLIRQVTSVSGRAPLAIQWVPLTEYDPANTHDRIEIHMYPDSVVEVYLSYTEIVGEGESSECRREVRFNLSY